MEDLPGSTRSQAKRVYTIWSLALLLMGTVNLVQVAGQIGTTYGGFVWAHDRIRVPPFYIGAMPWRARPPSPQELCLFDTPVTIDGRSPWAFEQVYSQKQPGDPVVYQVRRGEHTLTIVEPVRLFTWDVFLLIHGLFYLAGLSA